MSTLIYEKDLFWDNERELLITALRKALNAAESGEDEVIVNNSGMEITWIFSTREFFIIG